jgi:hypothetical protein
VKQFVSYMGIQETMDRALPIRKESSTLLVTTKTNGMDRSGRIAFHRRGPRRSGSGQRITQLAVLHSMSLYPFPPLFRPLMSAKCCRDSSYPVLSVVQPKVPLRETAPIHCSQADRLREGLAPA